MGDEAMHGRPGTYQMAPTASDTALTSDEGVGATSEGGRAF